MWVIEKKMWKFSPVKENKKSLGTLLFRLFVRLDYCFSFFNSDNYQNLAKRGLLFYFDNPICV